MAQQLTNAQTRYLRGLAHSLKPVIMVGAKGITDNLLAELDGALTHHELVKVKFAVGDRDERDAAVKQLVDASKASLVQRIGNVACLYRRHPKKPQIILPKG
ncbi:MAG: ribosome assembly RNA-binding protein YhbY [Rhodanobacteraceae bacterium]|nr:ribosome assembly RNA-binding protein YhbY [Xanthomonadales bacterium]MCP5478274.1 ribosome assembly RNA-binding protein YhbY [Rhodanobacteraceae bacterium]HPF72962.1 ribosome assembly RNA-binding protein YhbY [Xanthomonadaceae bacterium]HRY00963.1 ribosome assembly RNA-binding protein YhbY [Xanthomonadaceae bacterium]